MTFEIKSRKTIHRGRVFELQSVQLQLPDGRLTHYDIVAHPGAVTLVPLDDEGNILFVCQYRAAADQEVLELPAGTLEVNEPPEECAGREVREETGMAAANLREIGEMYMVPGYSSEYMHIYLATGLYHDPLGADDDEFLKVEKIPARDALDMVRKGGFIDAKTIAGLLLAEPFLGL
jgi:ADP-ribose pyrophosphatase